MVRSVRIRHRHHTGDRRSAPDLGGDRETAAEGVQPVAHVREAGAGPIPRVESGPIVLDLEPQDAVRLFTWGGPGAEGAGAATRGDGVWGYRRAPAPRAVPSPKRRTVTGTSRLNGCRIREPRGISPASGTSTEILSSPFMAKSSAVRPVSAQTPSESFPS